MSGRIHYNCTKCGWSVSITEQWSDLKPRKCVKCGVSFLKQPECLSKFHPQPPKLSEVVTITKPKQ
jgi:DNA-directed RNA polymerase subunit RPC12/RpoP